MRKLLIAAAAAALLAVHGAQAATVTYNFSWTGSGGYTMTGHFSFDSASAADGAIRDGEVTSLFFEGFLNGVSVGSNSTAHTLSGFNFNFDPVAGQFFLNGNAMGDSGQRWNDAGNGLGFVNGLGASILSINGQYFGFRSNPAPLVASLDSSVPAPATLALVGLALTAGALARRR